MTLDDIVMNMNKTTLIFMTCFMCHVRILLNILWISGWASPTWKHFNDLWLLCICPLVFSWLLETLASAQNWIWNWMRAAMRKRKRGTWMKRGEKHYYLLSLLQEVLHHEHPHSCFIIIKIWLPNDC